MVGEVPSAANDRKITYNRVDAIPPLKSMKTLLLLSAALGLVTACAVRAADSAAASSRVDVVFDHPEKFTDVKDSYAPSDHGRDAILGEIRGFLVRRAEPMLPGGYKLTLTFTDIDLAGEFEPWRGQRWDDVRIVKQVYPPAFKFTYSVSDPAGRVVKEGSEDIRDINFQMRVVIDTSDPLRYEKDILGDWVRSNLRGIRKG